MLWRQGVSAVHVSAIDDLTALLCSCLTFLDRVCERHEYFACAHAFVGIGFISFAQIDKTILGRNLTIKQFVGKPDPFFWTFC